MKPLLRAALVVSITGLLASCDYVRLLRPSVLRQLNPDVVRLVNALPAVQPWHQGLSLVIPVGGSSSQIFLNIPTGKRLVLEHVTGEVITSGTGTPFAFFWGENPSGSGVGHTIHLTNVGHFGDSISQNVWRASHPMKMYLDSALVRVSLAGTSTLETYFSLSFSGYLIDP